MYSKIKFMSAEIKLLSHVCQENAWRANQEREKHNGGSDDQSCFKNL